MLFLVIYLKIFLFFLFISSNLFLILSASFGCSCGDTLASELGPVLGNSKSQPAFHIIQLKNVPKGTNGGVSFYGTIASGIGGIAVGLGYYIALAIACLFSKSLNYLIFIKQV